MTTTLIHDIDDQSLVLGIVDFRQMARDKAWKKLPDLQGRRKIIFETLKVYDKALLGTSSSRRKEGVHKSLENKIYSLYSKKTKSLSRLLSGKVMLHSQQGLADEFLAASKRAQKYLNYMEKVFTIYNLPKELTCIPFVESMFNNKSQSKVGASGLWQFMKVTAKHYMIVNDLVDERNSPFKSTWAAAKLLEENWKKLGSWPLAVTSYNHGLTGIYFAQKSLKSKSLEKIIKTYKNDGFRYASKNYFSEVKAASEVYELLMKTKLHKIKTKKYLPLSIILNKPSSLEEILSVLPISEEVFKEYNPDILPSTFSKNRSKSFPINFEIFYPLKLRKEIIKAQNSTFTLRKTNF
ncbi:MAG: hypothetical protein CMP11_01270 [Zetaproteobacteria bacterium]|nr:hypothetical protein [Pseudobdellovibrionaceae bacterium]